MALKQLHLIVRGRVQGVYFRASTQREARRLGLGGWVKNRADGSVEILAGELVLEEAILALCAGRPRVRERVQRTLRTYR